jgi:thermostable 8-oxoguanine DNA glycosylase
MAQGTNLEDFHKDKSPMWKLMYSAVVAGKSAQFATRVMNELDSRRGNIPISDFVEIYDIEVLCRDLKTGNYNKMSKCWKGIIDWFNDHPGIDWKSVTPEDLETIHGIGPKTSRFFLMWVDPDIECAALDTHILKWLNAKGHDVPRSTPSKKKYVAIEKIFLKEAAERDLKPVELDWQIWDAYAHKKEIPV